MPAKKASTEPTVLTLKVTLRGSKPPIWRRIQVLSTTTLGDLHYVIQIAMGWTNSHLHAFETGKRTFAEPNPDYDPHEMEVFDEDEVTVGEVLKRKGMKLLYRYDFGDDWEHDVILEETAEPGKNTCYARCVAGEMACPPDDCGGLYGYYRILQILEDPDDDEYETYADWMPKDFDPEAFNLRAANAGMKHIKQWRRMAEE